MSKPQKTLATTPMHMARQNEGFAIDLIRTTIEKEGKSVTVLQGNMSNAPVPDRRYSAEIADVVEHRKMLRLMFAQEEADLISLRSMVVISVTHNGIRQFLDSLLNLGNGLTLEGLAKTSRVEQDLLTAIKSDAKQGTVGLRASSIVMAVAGEEVCLDFYQASAFAIRAGNYSNKLSIEPIVRVELSFALFLAVVQKLRALAAEWVDESAQIQDEVPK